MHFAALTLFLDLRGVPSAGGALRDFLSGVAALQAEPAEAIGGLLLQARQELSISKREYEVLEVDGSSLRSRQRTPIERIGAVVFASASASTRARADVYEFIRRPEANLALLGSGDETFRLFDFALAQAQHCRGISGSKTTLLCECPSIAAFDAVAAAENSEGIPIGVVLPPKFPLWAHALSACRSRPAKRQLHERASPVPACRGLLSRPPSCPAFS